MTTESKMLKAKCKKTGRYYGIELKMIGSEWKAVNMVLLSDDERRIILSEVMQPKFETNKNLIACPNCGNRKVSGCSCARKKQECTTDMKYKFDCIYCDELKIDYSRSTGRLPYTEWAGTSNIPSAIKDRYGNPQGSQYDLAKDGSFRGYVIIVLNLCDECDFTQPKLALQKKGFRIIEHRTMPSPLFLKQLLSYENSQLWIISHKKPYMNDKHIEIIHEYFNSGHGVYVWGDNDPYYADANVLLERMFNTEMYGNSRGDCVLGMQTKPCKAGFIPNHPIATGIMNFYEGITIAEVAVKQNLIPLLYGSNDKVVAAYYDSLNKRAIVDGGFTRLYFKWDSAGTDRYIVNAAAWLANVEYFGYNN